MFLWSMRITPPDVNLSEAALDRDVAGDFVGIEEVILYITALIRHLQGMSATAQREEQLSHKSGIWGSAEFNVS